MAAKIAEAMRDRAYLASIQLARERDVFPMFNKDLYLSGGNFASRLPQDIKDNIRKHGLRNSHLLSIAPTGTISLAFADNASNGIEPAFSWTYTRKKRMPDGSLREYAVEDHAWRLYRHLKGADAPLPAGFVSALELSARRGMVPASEVAGLRALLQATGLPTEPPADMTAAKFLELMARDKKVVDGRLRLVLLEAIGSACIVDDADERELVGLLETPANG